MLAKLEGSLRLVQWANSIRKRTLDLTLDFGLTYEQVNQLSAVKSARWWIVNRDLSTGALKRNWSLDGLETKMPVHSTDSSSGAVQQHLADVDTSRKPKVSYAKFTCKDMPTDMELFSASVSRNPALAEVTLLAFFAKCYKNKDTATFDRLNSVIASKMRNLRSDAVAAIDKDINAIERIIHSNELDK
jgi:hypothetical protein